MNTLPSSEAEAMIRSLKGFLSSCELVGSGGTSGDDTIPISIQNSRSMATEQRHLIRQLSSLAQGNNRKGTSTRGIPIDREIFGVGLK